MALTTEQKKYWDEIDFDGLPVDASTQERNFYVASIRHAFTFEGIEPPSDDDILAAAQPSTA